MRVLHVYSGNLYGGIEAILASIAATAPPGSHLHHEFALSFEGRLSRELEDAGAIVHPLGAVRARRPRRVAAARRRLSEILDSRRFHCLICHGPWSQALFGAIARRRKVSLVFWAHDAMSGRHWTERIARRTVPDLVICNSHYTASTLPALYPGVRSVVVYAPVATRSTPIDAAVRHRIRAALRTEAASVVIVQASRSEAWKGHAVLVEALAKARHIAGWTWWQVGGAQRPEEAEYLEQLQVRARDLGITDRVRWLGERTDVPRLLAAADVYCQANVAAEPFGVVFIEALAAGLPVITTRLGGACEIVDETCGILVPPSEPDSLCAAICTLIEDAGRRRALAMAAPGRARRLCSPATELAKLEEALARLATLAVPA